MVAPTVSKIRSANLARLQLTPQETTYLLAAASIANLVLGVFVGILL